MDSDDDTQWEDARSHVSEEHMEDCLGGSTEEETSEAAAHACAPPAATTAEDELPAAAGSGEAHVEEHAEDAAEEGALEEEGEGEEEVVNPFPDLVYADGRVIRRTRRVPDEADELPDEKKDADMATAFKEEGNRNFGGANFDAAVGCYTEALKHLPRDTSYSTQRAIFYANRAACYIKQLQWEDALHDCDRAIEHNPAYSKAYARRATVFEGLEKLDEALADAKSSLELEPGNKTLQQKIASLEKKIVERDEKMKEEMLGKLKEMGNWVLGKFGLSVDNFKAVQDPNTGSYSISFQK